MKTENNEDEEDFFEVEDFKEHCPEIFAGFQLVPQPKSILMPSKKGYMQALADEVKVKVTNLYYKLQESSKRIHELKIVPGDCYFLGTRIKSHDDLTERYEKLIYFSYREFDIPIVHQSQKLFNDTCWGCTIRCAQMMFAQIVQGCNPKLSQQEVVEMFYDEPKCPLSIQNICKMGNSVYTGKPGSYWSCLTAMLSIRDLYVKELSKSKFSNGQNNTLSCFTFTNNVMSFEEITKSKFGLEEMEVVPEEADFTINQIQTVLINRKLVFFIGMFGGETISEENFYCLKEIFKLSSCKGMIAGVDTRAYYLFGTLGDQFMYLDPHKTQKYSSTTGPCSMDSYHPSREKINVVDYKCFNPCIGIAFLLVNNDELNQLKSCFKKMITEFYGSFFTDQGDCVNFSEIKDLEEHVSTFDSIVIDRRRRKSSEDDFVLVPNTPGHL